MANVKVAIRVRPLSARESTEGGRIAVQVEDKVLRIQNMKQHGRPDGLPDSRGKLLEFGFDYCYWSVDPGCPNYANQEEVFQDLGVSVLAGASEGYNVCLFAYGQTGTGKTYTMMGTPASMGLTPRICQGLFSTDDSLPEGPSSCRVEISFLEIYNERVRDLLRVPEQKKPNPLRVREHPEKGPYVQGLSQFVVSSYKQAVDLLEQGISNRITAATHVHDASSRSHAIFSIQYTQAIFENNLPSEIVSKINLVDLAGSERAGPHYCRDRITEGSNINKSLVTLGIVISALAQNSQMFSSCQSINSMASEGEGSTAGSQSSSLSGGGKRHCFIPYRDSVLTWLLKDSLGGNSRTIMIATVSPSCSSYSETLSTLRYAAHARNIVNKPRINEDANVRLIRELREEIDRLKSMLLSFEMQRNPSPSLSDDQDVNISDIVLQNELQVEQLTQDWSERWRDKKELLEQYSVDINRDQAGFLIHSLLPHLIALNRDVLSTGVTFYHLREGVTKIGPQDQEEEHHIVLQGEARCEIENQCGVVTLRPVLGTVCMVNKREVTEACRLAQGAVITLGEVHKFRFNHPAEAAILRDRRRASEGVLSCGSSDLSPHTSDSRAEEDCCWERDGNKKGGLNEGAVSKQRVEEQQRYVECLREEIQAEQLRVEKDLEREQAQLRQQHIDIEQWILQEKNRLIDTEKAGTHEFGIQTDVIQVPYPEVMAFKGLEGGASEAATPPSSVVENRKRVVQEELLRHHALRRAESHVRRKRLRYQLERIARKRHLLEAKRELQRLENSLIPDSATSHEPSSLTKTRWPPRILRRHSFSADLLSRLYPQHTPIFRHFLKRNKTLELSPSKWVSDECLPSRGMRRRANTLPSRNYPSFEAQPSFSENLMTTLTDTTWTNGGQTTKRKLSLTKSGLIRGKKEESRQNVCSVEPHYKGSKNVATFNKSSSSWSPPKGAKLSSQGNKSLERIRKMFYCSVGSGIKTALSRVFRKPPSGVSRCRGPKSINAGQFHRNIERGRTMKSEMKQSKKCPMKMTSSCEDLEKISSTREIVRRRWHSAEALSKSVIRQAREQPTYPGWMENKKEEDEEDSDSSYSVDSLSSAYATALAKQLQQEDNDLSGDENKSEPESVDSQMSQDSLVMESDGKKATVRPMLKQPLLTSHFCSHVKEKKTSDRVSTWEDGIETFSTLGPCTSNEMPAEAYWRLSSAPRTSTTNKTTKEPLSLQQSKQDTETITSEKSDNGPLFLDGSPGSFSCSNVEETENILVLTDAWSSTETSDSPRIHRDSMAVRKQAVHNPVDSQSSIDCSVSLSGSESQTSLHSDCTEDKNGTLEKNKCWDSESDDTLLMLGDEKIIGLMDTVKTQDQEPVSCEVSHFVGSSGIVLHFDQRAELTIAVEKSGCPERREVNQNVSPEGPLCLPESAPSMVFETYHLPPDSEPEKKYLIHNEYPFCLKERKIQQICSQSDKEMQGERNREGHVLLKCNSNVARTDCSSIETSDKILLCSMISNSQVDSPKEYQEKQPDPVVRCITENNLNGSDNQQFPTICSSLQDRRANVVTKNSVYNDLTGSPQIIFEPKFQLLFETKLESSSCHKLASEEEKVHEHVEGVVENSHCEKVLQRSKSIEPEEKEESEVGGSKSSTVKNYKKRCIPEAMTLYSLQNSQTQPMHKSLQPSDRGNVSRKKRKGCIESCKCSMKMSKNCWTEEKNASAAANNGSLVNIINASKEKRMVLTSDVSFQLKRNKVDMLEGRVNFSSGEKNTVMPSGIEILAINPAAIIKENRNDLSPIDLKISEVVEEHMKVTMKEMEEVINNDEQEAQEALTYMLTKHQKENKPCTLISNDISSLAEKPAATSPHDINDSLEILDTRDVKDHQPITVITAPKKSHSVVQMFPHIKDDYIRIDIADVYLKEDQTGFRPKEIESEMGQGSQDHDIMSYDRVNNISNALNINSRVSLHMTEEHGHTEVVLSNEQKAVMSDKSQISNGSRTVTKVQESQEVENVSATDHIMHTETVDKEGTLKQHTANLIVLNSGKDTEGAFTINQTISVDNYRKDLTAVTTERREEMIRKPGIEQNDNERHKHSSLCLFEDCQEYKLVDNILHKQDRPGHLTKHNCSGDNSTSTNKASSSQEREIKINISFPHAENHKNSAVLEQTCHQVSDNPGKEDCLDMQIYRSTGQHKQFQANTKSSLQVQAEVSLTDETEPNILENLCHDILINVKHEGVNKKSTSNLNVELVQNVSEHHLNPAANFPFDSEMYSDEQKPRAEIGFSEETSKSQYESCKLADITEILRSGKIQSPTIDCSIDGRENSQRNCVKCNSSKEKQAEENCKISCNKTLNYPCQTLKEENAYQKQDYKLPVNCFVGQTIPFNNRSTQLSNFFSCSGNLDKHQDNLFKGQNYDKESCNITTTATVDHCMTDLYKSEVVLNAQFIDGNDICSFEEILEGNEKISPISSSSTQPLQSNKLSQTLKNTLSRSAICNLAKGFYSIKDEKSPIEEASFAQYYTNCSSSNQAKQTEYPKHSSQVPQTLNEFSFPSSAEPPKTTQGFEEGGKKSPMTYIPEPSEEPQSAKKEKASAHGILQHDLDSFAELKASYVRDKTTSRSDCTRSHRCNNAENKKVKPKMFRRPNAKTAPAPSTESTLDKSPEENAVPRVFLGRSSSKRDRPKVQNPYKQEEEVKSKQDQKLVSSPVHISLKSDHALETCRESLKQSLCTSCTEHDSKTRDEEDKSQGEHSHIVHPPIMTQLEKKTLPSHNENGAPLTANLSDVCYKMQKHMKRHDLSLVEQKQVLAEESQTLRKMDEAMHFASSDINPFVHPWQQKESDRVIYKHPVFGSATDLSMKAPNLEISDDKVTRCCSVDNGLNVHHSPFHSHLSTFASNKGLSSTLSSIECLKEKGQCRSNTVVKMGANDSYCSDVSLDLRNSCVKVDEFVLISSSEQESSGPLRKDHALVTSITKVAGREKKKIRHKRSSTHVPVTSVDTEKIRERNTWVSLQNMSLHLTQLLHNTSDLLGNIQCVRENDALLSPAQLSNQVSPPHSNGCNKRDSATQTAVDIGIQTEGISKPVRISDTFKVPLMEEKSKPSEVNVIVKVFGTDMLGVSQEKEEITLTLQESLLDRRANKKMKSMPDIRLGTAAERSCLLTEAVPLNVRASTPYLDTSLQSCSHFSTDGHPLSSCDHVPDQVLAQISSSTSQTVGMRKQSPRKEDALCHNAKVVQFTDRASSPILTVDAGVGTQIYRSNSTQCLVNRKTGLHKPAEENDWKQRRSQSASIFQDQIKLNLPFEKKKMSEDIFPVCVQSRKPCGFPHNESTDSVSFKNVSDKESKTLVNLVPFIELEFQNESRNGVDRVKRQTVNTRLPVSGLQPATPSPRLSSSSSHPNNKIIDQSNTSSVISRQPAESQLIDCRQGRRESQYKYDKDLCYRKQTLEYYQSASDNAGQCWSSPSEPSSISEGTVPLPDDDAASVALSECNTDILVNIKPLIDAPPKEHRWVPEDLPMHNKFTNWSGVNFRSPSSLSTSEVDLTSKCKSNHPDLGLSESRRAKSNELNDIRMMEIEKLRQEREQVMATVCMDMNPHQLTVELTEAKLHYGLGETDAQLKLLKSGSTEKASAPPSKQQLYNSHRRSIEGLCQEREARLQTYQRARSLSPRKHTASPRHGFDQSVRTPESPSRRREFLQQLRQVVVKSTRVTTEPPRQAGQCPSEIEQLLRDYGRAREEARTEIARARDRLRERTELEKRRLQQQTLSQVVKDDLRFRTRVSHSTLCTGSSLSLSSGPTSGYNSSNTVLLKEGGGSSQAEQVSSALENGRAQFSSRPPIKVSQSLQTHRPWLSAQDVRVEATVTKNDPQLPSLLSPFGRQCTLSLSSASSISTSYQDMAACALAYATAEVQSAADGDLGNLLVGKALNGWRCQGKERGVQAFYKPSSNPSVHSFLGAVQLERPLHSLWCMIRDHSKMYLYHQSICSAWTRPLNSSTQLVYLLTESSACHLTQPRDFCCISTESKQEDQWVVAMRSVSDEFLPRPSVDAIRGELLPSGWFLQPSVVEGREVIRVVYLLQVDLVSPAFPQRLLSLVAKKQAAVIAELDALFTI